MTDHWKSSLGQHMWKHIWIHGFVIGVGAVLIGVLIWFFITETPSSSNSHPGEMAPQVQVPPGAGLPSRPPVAPQARVDSPPPLKSQLAQVLAGIRQANQKKDLPQLLSHYSPSFPQLQQRTEHISQSWKIYDYPKMDFEMTEVKLLDDRTAVARVTWEVETHHIGTRQKKNISKTYLMSFVRESDHWRIKALDKTE